jgi:hypothetical protein
VIGATMPTMWRTAGYAAALVGLTLMIAAAAQNHTPAFAKFKSEMMPQVGQKITVVGTLHDGKQGFWLAFNNWGAYIYRSTRETDGTLDFTGVWLLRLWGFGSGVRVIQPSSSLWECGNPASFAGFPSAGGTVEKSGVGLFHGFPRASFPQRTCSE